MTELLRITDLQVRFKRGFRTAPLMAVDGVTFHVQSGETVGLVGESGSGKSTIGNAILGLAPVFTGSIGFEGEEIAHLDRRSRRRLSKDVQVVFQDPYGSLNPSRTIGQTLEEPLQVHASLSRAEMASRVGGMLERVGLRATDRARYPAAFSGGQRQRVAIARALMVGPKLIVCDEAVSALDLSSQAQVLNLMRDLQTEFGMAMLFISHDLAVINQMAHRTVVLHRGRIVEQGETEAIYREPAEAYTRRLIDAAPIPDPSRRVPTDQL